MQKAQHKASNCCYKIECFKEITKESLFVTIEHLWGEEVRATVFSHYSSLVLYRAHTRGNNQISSSPRHCRLFLRYNLSDKMFYSLALDN